MTTRIVAAIAALATGMLFIACGGDSDNETPSASPTPPADEAPRTPIEAETGIQPVDDAIDALLAGDTEAVVSQMQYIEVECAATPVPLYFVPPCGDAPDASLIDAFPMAACEGDNIPRDEAMDGVRQALAGHPERAVYGVYRTAGSSFEEGFFGRAGPEYAIVLESEAGGSQRGWAVLVNDAGVAGVATGCAEAPADFVTNWVLTDAVAGPGA